MRHAVSLGENLWMGMDNSSGIGEKPHDVVQAPNALVASMAARVALLELWCVGAEPESIFMMNFTGNAAWSAYEKGLQHLFEELGTPMPHLAGSTESNIETLQSGIAIQFIGRVIKKPVCEGNWYLLGTPLVGQAVVERANEVISLSELQKARQSGIVSYVHPCGSGGVAKELERLGISTSTEIPAGSAGPSTCVLVRSMCSERELVESFSVAVRKL